MTNKKTLIIYQSIHHNNTEKVAKVIAKELNADLKKPSQVKNISKYDLIGFGSGIYNGKHHRTIMEFIDNLDAQDNKDCFVFSSASFCIKKMHEPIKKELTAKGFNIIDDFICRGFINFSFVRLWFGGLNKNRPNKEDLKLAKDFAKKIKNYF